MAVPERVEEAVQLLFARPRRLRYRHRREVQKGSRRLRSILDPGIFRRIMNSCKFAVHTQ